MRVILSIFALSMFLACQEETISNVRQCGRMTISDALPVQFWLTECETFNEYEAQGVHHVCWCQPWNCDDEIVVQFQDEAAQEFFLTALSSEEVVIFSQQFSEIQSGVYQLSFIPQDEDICDEQIRLLINSDANAQKVVAPSAWTELGGAWTTKTATQFTLVDAVYPPGPVDSYQELDLEVGDKISFDITVTLSGTITGIFYAFVLTDESLNACSLSVQQSLVSGTNTYTVTLTATQEATRIQITVGAIGGSGTTDLTLTFPVGEVLKVADVDILAKSDCLDIQTAHDETTFFEYSNQRNFDGLIYANDSPDTTFGIRVPCRFFHQVEPEEDDAMELTSSIITTSSQVKTQRLLEVKHVPYYFHKKLRRVLKHQTLTIFDKAWKKEEKYEVNEGNKRWPLKSATCLLTEKNSVVRNVL